MSYLLLTGATGLLGGFLVRDLLEREIPLAVLVRPTRRQSSRQRMDAILARWERTAARCLPRPVVLEGDLGAPGIGLCKSDQQWIAEHCHGVVHNAASLSFVEKNGEPWQTNVEGTRNLLDFCQVARIQQFFHVSTTYVCGLREGIVREDELDVGQSFGNIYERSKAEAERLLRASDQFRSLTVFRPAIIIGDSQTGFTSTFHGFYTPLQLVYAMLGQLGSGSLNLKVLLDTMELSGTEQKNLVPVDWVSKVMAKIIATEPLHGKTYHLSPARRVSLAEMSMAFDRALASVSPLAPRKSASSASLEDLLSNFRKQLLLYRSYWRDDPQFDCRNTASAAPELPCPTIDVEFLARHCRFAIRRNFTPPTEILPQDTLDLQGSLRSVPLQARDHTEHREREMKVGLQVNGPGGGQWTLTSQAGRVVAIEPGSCESRIYCNSQVFQDLVLGKGDIEQALSEGWLLFEFAEGAPVEVQQSDYKLVLRDLFVRLADAPPRSQSGDRMAGQGDGRIHRQRATLTTS